MSQEAIPAPQTGPLVEAFETLALKCNELPEQPRVVEQTEKVLSSDEMEARKALLITLETSLLPSLRQQLSDLQESLDLETSSTPTPKLDVTLEITTKLGEALDQIGSTANSLAPSVISLGEYPSRIDQNYGVLKQFKCESIREQINTMTLFLGEVFRQYARYIRDGNFSLPSTAFLDESVEDNLRKKIIDNSAGMSRLVGHTIRWSQLSSFSAIQYTWEDTERKLSVALVKLTDQINGAIQLQEPEPDPFDVFLNPPGGFENNIAEPDNNPGGLDQDEDMQSVGNLSDIFDDEAEGFLARAPPPSQQFALRPRVIELMRLTIPLLKLFRMLFRKLWNNPISKPPFKFSEEMCSYDLMWISGQSGQVAHNMDEICALLYRIHDADAVDGDLQAVKATTEKLRGCLDCCLALIGFHIVPLAPLPPSGNLYHDYFYPIRCQIRLALNNFQIAVDQLDRDAP